MGASISYLDHYTEGRFAPWVTERRLVASAAVWMLDIAQPAGDYPDPPVSELVIQRDLSGLRASCDFGAGRFQTAPGQIGVVAPHSATRSCSFARFLQSVILVTCHDPI